MEQNSGLLALKGKCDLSIRLDMWKNGSKFVSHDYASNVFDYSVTNQNLLLARIMTNATQNVTGQIVPDIINDFSISNY